MLTAHLASSTGSSPTRSWRRRVPLLLVVGSLLAAGCGGDDSEQSDADFQQAATTATEATSQLGEDVGAAVGAAKSQTDAQLEETFGGLTTRVRGVVDDLKALDPPDASSENVGDLTAALTTAADDLQAITEAAGGSGPGAERAAAARAATEKLARDSPAISEANAALKAQLSAGSK